MVDLDGQAQLQRYLEARDAYSEALAKAAILETGKRIVTEEWRAFYSAEFGWSPKRSRLVAIGLSG